MPRNRKIPLFFCHDRRYFYFSEVHLGVYKWRLVTIKMNLIKTFIVGMEEEWRHRRFAPWSSWKFIRNDLVYYWSWILRNCRHQKRCFSLFLGISYNCTPFMPERPKYSLIITVAGKNITSYWAMSEIFTTFWFLPQILTIFCVLPELLLFIGSMHKNLIIYDINVKFLTINFLQNEFHDYNYN